MLHFDIETWKIEEIIYSLESKIEQAKKCLSMNCKKLDRDEWVLRQSLDGGAVEYMPEGNRAFLSPSDAINALDRYMYQVNDIFGHEVIKKAFEGGEFRWYDSRRKRIDGDGNEEICFYKIDCRHNNGWEDENYIPHTKEELDLMEKTLEQIKSGLKAIEIADNAFYDHSFGNGEFVEVYEKFFNKQ